MRKDCIGYYVDDKNGSLALFSLESNVNDIVAASIIGIWTFPVTYKQLQQVLNQRQHPKQFSSIWFVAWPNFSIVSMSSILGLLVVHNFLVYFQKNMKSYVRLKKLQKNFSTKNRPPSSKDRHDHFGK